MQVICKNLSVVEKPIRFVFKLKMFLEFYMIGKTLPTF